MAAVRQIELKILAGGQAFAWNNPNAPVTVSIPYTQGASELGNPESLVVWQLAGNSKPAPILNSRYDAATGALVFQTTGVGTYAVAYAPLAFEDLANVAWAKQAIAAMAARDIVQGTAMNSFSPAAPMKRADFVAPLVRTLGLKGIGQENTAAFSDVQKDVYYSAELAIAKQLGIVTGYGDNTFQPDSPISRQEMMVIASRALATAGKVAGGSGTLADYSDADRISGYAKDSLAVLV